jgi:hypothetical protein
MHGADRVPDLQMITSEPRLGKQNLQLERNGVLFFQHMLEGAQKGLDTADMSETRFFANSGRKYSLRDSAWHRELMLIQPCVNPSLFQQFSMPTALHYSSVLDHQNLISLQDCRKPVRDDDRSSRG